MKAILLIVPFFISSNFQDIKSPRIAILNANEFILGEPLLSEAKEYEYELTDDYIDEELARMNAEDDREFVQKMNEMELEFRRKSDISSEFTLSLYTWLTYKLYGIFDDAIIYPVRKMNEPSAKDYLKMAEEYDVNWIVNLKKIEIREESDGLKGLATFELWNLNTKEITLATQLEIEDTNHGFELSCEEGTISCIMTNGSSYITQEVMKSMFSDDKYWW